MWREGIRGLAAQQYGVIAWHQVAGMGVARSQARRELEGRAWRRVGARVWALLGAPASPHRAAMAGLLAAGPGAVLSHQTAAALWEVPGFRVVTPFHVSRCRGSNGTNPPDVVVHRLRRLPVGHVTVLDGFPVVRPERIPFDLAAAVHPQRLERIVDDLWSRRLVSGATLQGVLDQLAGRGRSGIGLMRQLLAERSGNWVPPASGLEARVATALRRHGLPTFERQVALGGEVWVGRVDFVNRPAGLVLEVQSDRYHASLSDRRADERRSAALRSNGWTVIEVWEAEVWSSEPTWIDRIRDHLRRAA